MFKSVVKLQRPMELGANKKEGSLKNNNLFCLKINSNIQTIEVLTKRVKCLIVILQTAPTVVVLLDR